MENREPTLESVTINTAKIVDLSLMPYGYGLEKSLIAGDDSRTWTDLNRTQQWRSHDGNDPVDSISQSPTSWTSTWSGLPSDRCEPDDVDLTMSLHTGLWRNTLATWPARSTRLRTWFWFQSSRLGMPIGMSCSWPLFGRCRFVWSNQTESVYLVRWCAYRLSWFWITVLLHALNRWGCIICHIISFMENMDPYPIHKDVVGDVASVKLVDDRYISKSRNWLTALEIPENQYEYHKVSWSYPDTDKKKVNNYDNNNNNNPEILDLNPFSTQTNQTPSSLSFTSTLF